jgi:hypothetical protein
MGLLTGDENLMSALRARKTVDWMATHLFGTSLDPWVRHVCDSGVMSLYMIRRCTQSLFGARAPRVTHVCRLGGRPGCLPNVSSRLLSPNRYVHFKVYFYAHVIRPTLQPLRPHLEDTVRKR